MFELELIFPLFFDIIQHDMFYIYLSFTLLGTFHDFCLNKFADFSQEESASEETPLLFSEDGESPTQTERTKNCKRFAAKETVKGHMASFIPPPMVLHLYHYYGHLFSGVRDAITDVIIN